ncbi:hypothetical protein MRB53_037560 [Persea americana]|nr:hypothetical protein MRB53_037560 [Persea americana]
MAFVAYGLFAKCSDNLIMVSKLCPPDMDHLQFASGMFFCAEACLTLCERLDQASNMLTVGDLINSATALGLHRDLENQHRASLLYVQERRNIFWRAWGITITLALFTGRPPPTSRRYATAGLPLDVAHDDLLTKDHSMITHTINASGWDANGTLHEGTIHRLFTITNLFIDEVLEMSLGRTPDNLMYKVAPPFSYSILVNKDKLALEVVWNRVRYQTLLFLIGRIGNDRDAYLNASQELLAVITTLWLERDGFAAIVGLRDCIHWTISAFGIPAASALAVDMLKQLSTHDNGALAATRSENVQVLSIFIAALSWIRPEEGNYTLCQRAKKVIKYILDRVLAPPKAEVLTPPTEFDMLGLGDLGGGQMPPLGMDFGAGIDFAGWMNMPWYQDDGMQMQTVVPLV